MYKERLNNLNYDLESKTVDELKRTLEGLGSKFKGNYCTCPFHRDTNPSAGVYESENGNWRFKCHVCDINEDIVGVLARINNKTPQQVIKDNSKDSKPIYQEKTFDESVIREMFSKENGYKFLHEYKDSEGNITHFVAIKYKEDGKKEIRQIKRYGFNFMFKNSGLRPLFNLDKIKDVDKVLIVEGEKCAICAEYCGIPSTTCMGGSNSVSQADLTPLKGKEVIVWPDNDEPGEKYYNNLLERLNDIDCKVGLVKNKEIGNIKKGADIVDYYRMILESSDKESAKKSVLAQFQLIELDSDYQHFMEDISDIEKGKYNQINAGFPLLQEDTRYTEGGQITLICGEAGVAKSFFMGQHFMRWALEGRKVKMWGAENNRKFHARRAFAQYYGKMHYCDMTWLHKNIDMAKQVFDENRKAINIITNAFYTNNDITKDYLIKWCEDLSKQGYEAIGIDPITFFSDSKNKKSFEGDLDIMRKLNELIDKYHTRFYVVTHPRCAGDFGLDNLAGSRGFGRFCQNALWMSRAETYYEQKPINIKIMNLKTRNGARKHGGSIGFYFDTITARFNEVAPFNEIEKDKGEF